MAKRIWIAALAAWIGGCTPDQSTGPADPSPPPEIPDWQTALFRAPLAEDEGAVHDAPALETWSDSLEPYTPPGSGTPDGPAAMIELT